MLCLINLKIIIFIDKGYMYIEEGTEGRKKIFFNSHLYTLEMEMSKQNVFL